VQNALENFSGDLYCAHRYVTEQPTLEIAQRRIFGPVLTIIPYEDEIEAISIANGTPYSLAAGRMGQRTRGARKESRLSCVPGSVSINGARTIRTHHLAGLAHQASGRERGRYGLIPILRRRLFTNDFT